MSETLEYDLTGNFGLKKPWLDADDDIWGQHTNENMDLIDNLLVTRGFDASKFLQLAGGVMEGMLTLAVDPVGPFDAATKGYVDTWGNGILGDLDNYLPLIGGEITGSLQVDGKLRVGTMVDAGFKLDVGGGTVRLSTNSVRIDNNAAAGISPATNVLLQLTQADGNAGVFQIDAIQGSGQLVMRRASGAGTARTALLTGQIIGLVGWAGYDGAAYSGQRLFINGLADGDWSPTSHPTRLSLNVTAANSITATEVLRVSNAGNLLLGTTVDAGNRLDVVGTARINGLLTLLGSGGLQSNGPVTVGSNTATQLLTLNGAAGSARVMQIQTAGSVRWQIGATGVAEAGGNVGSDLNIIGFSDTGSGLTPNPYARLFRATGNLTLGGGVDAGWRLDVVGTARVSGLLTCSAGAQMLNNLTVGTNTAANVLQINGPAGNARPLRFQTAGLSRWQIGANNAAESGANVGSDLDFLTFDDSGALLITAMRITRSTGAVRFFGNVGFNNTAGVARQTITGAKGGNTAVASVIALLVAYGLGTDTTTA